MTTKKILLAAFATVSMTTITAQEQITVGSGSYAEYTPLFKSATDQHGGDKSRIMETRRIYISDKKRRACANQRLVDKLAR